MQINYMYKALEMAKISYKNKDVPVGCVIVKNNNIVGLGHNQKEKKKNPLSHAELIAINNACHKLGTYHLEECDMYVTLEPCLMCVGAIINARIKNLYFAAYNKRYGAVDSHVHLLTTGGFNHKTDFQGGILEKESQDLLKSFFKELRAYKKRHCK